MMNQEKVLIQSASRSRIYILTVFLSGAVLILLIILAIVLYLTLFAHSSNSKLILSINNPNATNHINENNQNQPQSVINNTINKVEPEFKTTSS